VTRSIDTRVEIEIESSLRVQDAIVNKNSSRMLVDLIKIGIARNMHAMIHLLMGKYRRSRDFQDRIIIIKDHDYTKFAVLSIYYFVDNESCVYARGVNNFNGR